MAYQENRLSSLLVSGHFLAPDNLDNFFLLDYELGGYGLNDLTEGLRYQTWTLRYFPVAEDMVIEAPNTAPTILFNRPDITEISLAFDQNMNPFVAFVQAGQAVFWWFNTDTAATEFTNLPAGSLTPRCCLDDKRETQANSSDIILCYVDGTKLEMKRERDRYIDTYTQVDPFVDSTYGEPAVLTRIGMNKVNRLQWLCSFQNPLSDACA